MNKHGILVTGANGEIGQALVHQLHADFPDRPLLALDLKDPVPQIEDALTLAIQGDIADRASYERVVIEYNVDTIFHLAALLSTSAEKMPELAHRVNVEGTLNLLTLAAEMGDRRGKAVRLIFPSSIAAYGVKNKQPGNTTPVREDQHLNPITMYGVNKLYCEHLGRYYATHYKQTLQPPAVGVDFRCVRLPGVISADTVPSGGTSDYASEMIHAAAQGRPYEAFVRPDTTIPFMVMPDTVTALLKLAAAPREKLRRHVYNVTGFSLSAAEIAAIVRAHFPGAQTGFRPHAGRQHIVDSWPAVVSDSAARKDWGWKAHYDQHAAFAEYLIPGISRHYGVAVRNMAG